MKRSAWLILLLWLWTLPVSAAEWSLHAGNMVAPGGAARGVSLHWMANGAGRLDIAELEVGAHRWRQLQVECARLTLTTQSLQCSQGKLAGIDDLHFDLQADWQAKKLVLLLEAAGGEQWRIAAGQQGAGWHLEAELRAAQWARLAAWLPETMPKPTQGRLDGRIRLRGDGQGVAGMDVKLQIAAAGFADAAGLHAAEQLGGTVELSAVRTGKTLQGRAEVDWRAGELFWQPWYLHGGHRMQASGSWDGAQWRVTQAVAEVAGVGRIEGEASGNGGQSLEWLSLRGKGLGLSRAFADYVRPLLGEGALASSEAEGQADVELLYRDGAVQRLLLRLQQAGLHDTQRRFVLRGVAAEIPWSAGMPGVAQVRFDGGALWGVELGATQFAVQMNGLEFTLPQANLPVLDGLLSLRDFHLHREQGRWHWQFAGGLTPVSMERLSGALGWTPMHGTLSGVIPQVRYADGRLGMDGALLFRVFDGTAVVSRLALDDPFGPAPRLAANVDMRNLDLDLLTRTFSFGNMQGRVDVGVQGLELANWQPAAFNARIASSSGTYPRKISQKAVQNISSLGGAGAAAALQRGYLRMFENFGYDRIGLSCALRNDVCLMDGVEPNGDGYVIVKGGGIPAINVMGYNRAVGWSELLARVKRVMQENARPVIR